MGKAGQISRLATIYSSYRRRSDTCAYPPLRMWVEPTSHCNLQCPFCMNRQLPVSQKGFMDMDLYRSIVDQMSGIVHQINLFHRGEPLLHTRLPDMVRYAAEHGLQTRIHTNGTILGRDTARALLDSGLDIISFSFDGYDAEMYEANRVNARFDVTVANIVSFLQTRKELGLRKPFTALEVMEIADVSPGEMRRKRAAFLHRFDGLPLDKLVVRTPHNWAGTVGSEGISGGETHRTACPLLWNALAVFWDGRILPCPQDCLGTLKVGDAREDRIMDVWNGARIRDLRREMRQPSALSTHPCTECDRTFRRTLAGIPVDYLGRFVSEHVLSYGWLSKLLPH